ncbi:MAG TPA: peptidase [Nitrospirae bacterium]|nr:thermophilic metalloprotease [bacterium BMS3Abin09]GBE40975.1 thermophilic metalloprotease [bacterium BMS3Bbin09]HDO26228.1 peptidase [Nitrospirota bacterium]
MIDTVIKNLFKVNLDIKKEERLLIFTDDERKETCEIGKLFSKTGESFTEDVTYIEFRSTRCHGVEPPQEIWEKAFGIGTCNKLARKGFLELLINKKIIEENIKKVEEIIRSHKEESVNAIIALSHYSTSHTRFRKMLTTICGARYASMPLFDRHMLTGAMDVDWKKMAERSAGIAVRVNECEEIEISSPNGTAIWFSKKGREAKEDTGILTEPGSFSNLPAGEVYLAPLEGTAEGRLVLEWAPTRKLDAPVTIYIKNGEAVKVEGNEPFVEYLEGKLAEDRKNRNIAELGIGTNDKAARPDNILESEKILGTIHIALGDNSSFGGKVSTPFHQDFVFFRPTVTLICGNGEREDILKDGRLL